VREGREHGANSHENPTDPQPSDQWLGRHADDDLIVIVGQRDECYLSISREAAKRVGGTNGLTTEELVDG
jgi:hypothetical protein